MNCFLPYSDFSKSAQCLDYRRLGKQRTECQQILSVLERPLEALITLPLTGTSYWQPIMEGERSRYTKVRPAPWSNHPAVLMWRGYEEALKAYLDTCIIEWKARGYENNIDRPFVEYNYCEPRWLGDERLHSSHRAALLLKKPNHYKQFNWTEEPKMDYFWPTKHGY